MDPITLGMLIGWAGGCVLSVAGNRLDAGVVKVWNTFIRWAHEGKTPDSHALNRAVVRACLQAQLKLCQDCMNPGMFSRLKLSEREWITNRATSLRGDLRQVKGLLFMAPLIEALDDVALLVTPEGRLNGDLIQALELRILQLILKDDDVPNIYRLAIEESLFSVMRGYLAQEIADNEEVKVALDTQLLASLNGEIGLVVTQLGLIGAAVPRMEHTLGVIVRGLDDIVSAHHQPQPSQRTAKKLTLRPNPHFSGRDNYLKLLEKELELTSTVVIAGLGGVGKTQVANAFITKHELEYQFIFWVRAGDASLLADDYAEVSTLLQLPESASHSLDQKLRAVTTFLESNGRWLLVFDNAESPKHIAPFLPVRGQGHVLVTSRNPNWSDVGRVLPLDVWSLDESKAFLLKRLRRDDAHSDALATTLQYLPLALDQAAAYISETTIAMTDYLHRFRLHRQRLWENGSPSNDYPYGCYDVGNLLPGN